VTGLDRVIYYLYALCGLATVLGIPGVIIVALVLPADTARLVARWVFVAAALTPPIAAYLDVTYLLRGGGLHADALFALAALAYYIVFVIVGMDAAWWWRLAALVGLVMFHVACHEYLPRPIARRLGWRPPQYGASEGATGSTQ
jgi:hypothetical protein